jgi:hypothetical protein
MKFARVTNVEVTKTIPGVSVGTGVQSVDVLAPPGYVPVSGFLTDNASTAPGGEKVTLETVDIGADHATFVVTTPSHSDLTYKIKATFVEGYYIS